MPFFNREQDNGPNIDERLYEKIEVMVSFASDGRMKPIFARIKNLDDTEDTIKILTVKLVSEDMATMKYFCTYEQNGYAREIVLYYFLRLHLWAMNKK